MPKPPANLYFPHFIKQGIKFRVSGMRPRFPAKAISNSVNFMDHQPEYHVHWIAALIRLRMAEGGMGDIMLRANLSPMMGVNVMVGRSTYCPVAPTLSEVLQGLELTPLSRN